MLSMLDQAVQSTFPVVIAPIDGELPSATKAGTRYIVGAQGLVREVHADWMTHRKMLAPADLPYGGVQTGVTFHVPAPPVALMHAFVEQARAVLPNETAAVITLNTRTREWALKERTATLVTPDRIDYIEPTLDEDELRVLDIHSHGKDRAFFSFRDNRDDQGSIKLAAVVGRVHQADPQWVMRLVVIDDLQPIIMKEGHFVVPTTT